MGDLTIPQVQFPLVGDNYVFKSPYSPQSTRPQAVARLKKVSISYARPGKNGANISSIGGGGPGATHDKISKISMYSGTSNYSL